MACKNVINPPLIIFIALTFILTNTLDRVNATDPGTGLCRQTTHNDLCLSILKADPRSDLKFSPSGVATILRDSALSTSADAAAKTTDLLKSASDKQEIASLKSCSGGYSSAISSLKSIKFDVIDRTTYPSMVAAVNAGTVAGRDCEASFKKGAGVPSPLTAVNGRLGDVCDTLLEIISYAVGEALNIE
ncbi:hypothetical protein ABFS82_02G112800 [Erythranthe guttata]|uniref:pectinesterase inhibitor-like n=1 Tax=Erythranthe guttata TaxID=4155 RepID=UPI00064D7647|nr:PREDICTED: pectinesterase inhibitor-like [Erythranthe guttata]|eukprot:XP_012836366.1 PREDICTED: pectinesterase inhibitor-like [Erythranthe guttata]